jgi:hypothetical protein
MQFVHGWTERRAFRVEVSYDEFRALLATLKAGALPQISARPEDYRILLFGVLGEIFPGTGNDHNVSLGASATGLGLYLSPPRVFARR